MNLIICMRPLKKILIAVCFCMGLFSYANASSCSGLKINDFFAESDLIVQGVIVDAPITESDFLQSSHDYSFNISESNEKYVAYRKAHNNYLLDVSRYFKGDYGTNLIEISGSYNSLLNYKLGGEYIIFAKFIERESKDQLIVEPCIYVNFTESTVIWDQVINDTAVFGLFMNQLFKYSKDGFLSDFFGKADARSTKIFIGGE